MKQSSDLIISLAVIERRYQGKIAEFEVPHGMENPPL